jgi:hypothetical protein
MVLIACLTAVVGMLALNGLPQPYHPVFNVRSLLALRGIGSSCASKPPTRNSISKRLGQFLERLDPQGVIEVEP